MIGEERSSESFVERKCEKILDRSSFLPPSPQPSPKMTIRVLILGDGNFSFSLALAQLLLSREQQPSNIPLDGKKIQSAAIEYLGLPKGKKTAEEIHLLCTSFDSREEVVEKYPESEPILERLETGFASSGAGGQVEVRHRINAWELPAHFHQEFPEGFDAIVWNHPHLGLENFRLHRFLMAHFLHSAKEVLRRSSRDAATMEPRICVSLVQGQETRWDLLQQGLRNGLQLLDIQPFEESVYPGYICKRNKNGQSFKNVSTKRHVGTPMKSFLYRFVPGRGGREAEVPEALTTTSSTTTVEVEPEDPTVDSLLPRIEAMLLPTPNETTRQPLPVRRIVYDPEQRLRARQAKHSQKKSATTATVAMAMTMATIAGQATTTTTTCPPSKETIQYACPECDKWYTSHRAVQQHHHMLHVLKCISVEVQELPCPQPGCSRVFKQYQDLWCHRSSKHSVLTAEEEQWIMGEEVMREKEVGTSQVAMTAEDATATATATAAAAAIVEYQYVPCPVCGQAVLDMDGKDQLKGSLSYGMMFHLESLKPIVGLRMECPLSKPDDQGRCWCVGKKRFTERRSLEQHFRLCRQRKLESVQGER